MHLQRYRFTVEYKQGESNPADYLSRHPLPDPEVNNLTEHYIAYITHNAIPKAMTLEIENATAQDPVLQAIKSVLKTRNWHNQPADMARYGCMRGSGIVIPTMLQCKCD